MVFLNYFFTSLIFLTSPLVYYSNRTKNKYLFIFYGLIIIFFIAFFLFFGEAIFINDKYPEFSILALVNGIIALIFPIAHMASKSLKDKSVQRFINMYEIICYRIVPLFALVFFLYDAWRKSSFDVLVFTNISYIIFFYSITFVWFIFPWLTFMVMKEKFNRKFF